MYKLVKKVLFLFDPESAHSIASFGFFLLRPFNFVIKKMLFVDDEILHQKVLGVEFKNPVGLGAGFDKNATMIESEAALGFGYVEVGTITPKAQNGNPKPRLIRYPSYKSLQNAMGFNNDGMVQIKPRLSKKYTIPVGVNIGKNKTTPQNKAIDNYIKLVEIFSHQADYFVVNISSPNTPGLRDLQNELFVKELFGSILNLTTKPILLKIAPDMNIDDAKAICQSAITNGASGIVASNTTIDYSLIPETNSSVLGHSGGLSGAILKEKSFEFFQEIAKEFFGKTTLISVGGIDSASEAYRRIKAGASLVQIFTSFIFEGPLVVRNINKELIKLLKEDGYSSINEAIGVDIK